MIKHIGNDISDFYIEICSGNFIFQIALCKFLHQKFSGCTHWEGNVVLKKKLCEDKTESEGISVSTYSLK